MARVLKKKRTALLKRKAHGDTATEKRRAPTTTERLKQNKKQKLAKKARKRNRR